jgi:DNA-binding NtrC family response regulator
MDPSRILIVDDEPGIRRAWSRILSGAGYEVRDADSFRAARRILDDWRCDPCDIIFLDLVLGDGHGADLLPVIDGLDPKPAVAILSAYLDNDTVLENGTQREPEHEEAD